MNAAKLNGTGTGKACSDLRAGRVSLILSKPFSRRILDSIHMSDSNDYEIRIIHNRYDTIRYETSNVRSKTEG